MILCWFQSGSSTESACTNIDAIQQGSIDEYNFITDSSYSPAQNPSGSGGNYTDDDATMDEDEATDDEAGVNSTATDDEAVTDDAVDNSTAVDESSSNTFQSYWNTAYNSTYNNETEAVIDDDENDGEEEVAEYYYYNEGKKSFHDYQTDFTTTVNNNYLPEGYAVSEEQALVIFILMCLIAVMAIVCVVSFCCKREVKNKTLNYGLMDKETGVLA